MRQYAAYAMTWRPATDLAGAACWFRSEHAEADWQSGKNTQLLTPAALGPPARADAATTLSVDTLAWTCEIDYGVAKLSSQLSSTSATSALPVRRELNDELQQPYSAFTNTYLQEPHICWQCSEVSLAASTSGSIWARRTTPIARRSG